MIPEVDTLRQRAKLVRTLRETLDAEGFIEVETPIRVLAPANELHIDAPPSGRAYLRTSPELHMKRMLCAGYERIYQLGACFRQGERGDRHNPEFTMLEWYRAGAGYDEILHDLQNMVVAAAVALHGSTRFSHQGQMVDVATPWLELTVQEAFLRFAGWDPLEDFDVERFDLDMALKIEPALPRDRPCVLRDYPRQAAALSRLCPRDPRVAERWEAYACGYELCNAFGELTDAAEQRRRFEVTAAARRAMGAVVYPLDEDFLAAMETGMPLSSGAALGVDRLCMALLDQPDIEKVRTFCQPIGELW
jgi:lysyl-tRNA synthetase class 2